MFPIAPLFIHRNELRGIGLFSQYSCSTSVRYYGVLSSFGGNVFRLRVLSNVRYYSRDVTKKEKISGFWKEYYKKLEELEFVYNKSTHVERKRSVMYNYFVLVSIVFLLLSVVLMLSYFICLILGSMDLFQAVFWKLGFSLGARALSVGQQPTTAYSFFKSLLRVGEQSE